MASASTVTNSATLGDMKKKQKRTTGNNQHEESAKKKRKTGSRRNEHLEHSVAKLMLYGYVDAKKSPISGNIMFYPTSVQNPKLYEFARLVKKPLEKEADAFYCFLCNKEHNRYPGSSTQLKRHVVACLPSLSITNRKELPTHLER